MSTLPVDPAASTASTISNDVASAFATSSPTSNISFPSLALPSFSTAMTASSSTAPATTATNNGVTSSSTRYIPQYDFPSASEMNYVVNQLDYYYSLCRADFTRHITSISSRQSDVEQYTLELQTQLRASLEETQQLRNEAVRSRRYIQNATIIERTFQDKWQKRYQEQRMHDLMQDAFRIWKSSFHNIHKEERFGKLYLKPFAQRRALLYYFSSWRSNARMNHENHDKLQREDELRRLSARIRDEYHDECESLRHELTEMQAIIKQHDEEKERLEEKIRSAFVRGVCALNREALSVFNEKDISDEFIRDVLNSDPPKMEPPNNYNSSFIYSNYPPGRSDKIAFNQSNRHSAPLTTSNMSNIQRGGDIHTSKVISKNERKSAYPSSSGAFSSTLKHFSSESHPSTYMKSKAIPSATVVFNPLPVQSFATNTHNPPSFPHSPVSYRKHDQSSSRIVSSSNFTTRLDDSLNPHPRVAPVPTLTNPTHRVTYQ